MCVTSISQNINNAYVITLKCEDFMEVITDANLF